MRQNREAAGPQVIPRITVACDVGNPLYGPNGAAAIFGPQKGATPAQIEQLDAALRQLADRTGHVDLADMPGAGAAGGLGFALQAFFDAKLRSGIEIVMEATRLRQRLEGADLCITGEGKLDAQSLAGKVVVGVATACRDAGVPCIALAGALGAGSELAHRHGVTAAFSICDRPLSLDEALADTPELISRTATNVMRTFLAGRLKRSGL